MLVVLAELAEDTEAYGLKLLESRIAYASRGKNPEMIVCVAEGGELCLTSGDRKEPEDSDIYITSSPRSAKPSEGEEKGWGGGRYSYFLIGTITSSFFTVMR